MSHGIDPRAYDEWAREVAAAHAPAAPSTRSATAKPEDADGYPGGFKRTIRPDTDQPLRVSGVVQAGAGTFTKVVLPPLRYAGAALLPPPRHLQDRSDVYAIRRVAYWHRKSTGAVAAARTYFFFPGEGPNTDMHSILTGGRIPSPYSFELARLRFLYERDLGLDGKAFAQKVETFRQCGRVCLVCRNTDRILFEGPAALLPFTFDRPLYFQGSSHFPRLEVDTPHFRGPMQILAVMDGWLGLDP